MALFLCIYTFIKCEKEGAGALFFVRGREGGEGAKGSFLDKLKRKSAARAKSERRQRTEGLPGAGRWLGENALAGKGSGHGPPPSATGVEKVLGKVSVSRQAFNGGEVIEDAEKNFHFSSGFSFEIGCRSCGEKFAFLVRVLGLGQAVEGTGRGLLFSLNKNRKDSVPRG